MEKPYYTKIYPLFLLFVFIQSCHMGDSKLFHDGRTLVTKGRYQEAIPLLLQYLENYPNGKHASRAGLFLRKAHIAKGNFHQARKAWQMVMDQYPTSLEAHKSQYKLAMLSLLEGQQEQAHQLFQDLAAHPSGPLAADALAYQRYFESLSLQNGKTVLE